MHQPVTTIPCQHIVCYACLVSYLVRSNAHDGRARCPVCQTTICVRHHGAFSHEADRIYESLLAKLAVRCLARMQNGARFGR